MKNELKPKQWFIDRIGKIVLRNPTLEVLKGKVDSVRVFISDELQAQYMFDVQNDLSADGVYLNYRDEK